MNIARRTSKGMRRLAMAATLLALGTFISLMSAAALATTPSVIVGVNDGTGWATAVLLTAHPSSVLRERFFGPFRDVHGAELFFVARVPDDHDVVSPAESH